MEVGACVEGNVDVGCWATGWFMSVPAGVDFAVVVGDYGVGGLGLVLFVGVFVWVGEDSVTVEHDAFGVGCSATGEGHVLDSDAFSNVLVVDVD